MKVNNTYHVDKAKLEFNKKQLQKAKESNDVEKIKLYEEYVEHYRKKLKEYEKEDSWWVKVRKRLMLNLLH